MNADMNVEFGLGAEELSEAAVPWESPSQNLLNRG